MTKQTQKQVTGEKTMEEAYRKAIVELCSCINDLGSLKTIYSITQRRWLKGA